MSVYEGLRERLGKHHQPTEKLSGCHRVYQKCRCAEIELSGIIALTGKMGDWTGFHGKAGESELHNQIK